MTDHTISLAEFRAWEREARKEAKEVIAAFEAVGDIENAASTGNACTHRSRGDRCERRTRQQLSRERVMTTRTVDRISESLRSALVAYNADPHHESTNERHSRAVPSEIQNEFYASALRRKLFIHSTSCRAPWTLGWRLTTPNERTPASTVTAKRLCRLSSRARRWRTINNWIGSSRHPNPFRQESSRRVRQIKSRLGQISARSSNSCANCSGF